MTPRQEPRTLGIQKEIERLLRPLMADEQMELLGRIAAHITDSYPGSDRQLTSVFGQSYVAEKTYMARQRNLHRQDERGIS
jgi:hypothetical protein